ncbi:bromodomain and WD repeat-containing protein 3-like [Uranotaenia lowii]|uniref:bromodomain and WD repeat-containing protein 3-like n=1 Tax=Uranotaenia lowii TaxID=190385 RepID=UPI002478CAC1|nr:bromodomain and WD repeat-containing protein 3-like [Uranotaenia lowii]
MDTSSSEMQHTSAADWNPRVSELYFLISKFLANGPLRETAQVLTRELENLNILPTRLDWTGQSHRQSLEELERKYPHIGPHHLLEICTRIGPILDRELAPAVPGVQSLLAAGRQSVLRTKESVTRPPQLVDYCTRIHHMPLADAVHRNNTHNIVKVLYGRQSAGPLVRRQAIPSSFYSKQNLQRRTLGHLSAVYCVLFDRSGKYIITGADDLLVKLWSAIDGRLLATFRGASAEITDIAINLDNTMLAAGSLDRMLRVWDLQYGGPIAVLSGHTGMITSVNFCPSPRADLRFLVTTSTDGSVAFWDYTNRGGKPSFNTKPVMYHEKLRPGQAQMICASFSPGGIFLAAGSADHHVRVYLMSEDGPKRILETESHSDTVDSIQWAHNGLKFISGSKDGTALLWHFESQQWKSTRLNMTDRLLSCPAPGEENSKPKVTMVSWDNTDNWVITAVNDYTIKVWNAHTGKLHKVLRGHTNEIYVLESHQKDSGVLLSAGHDGQLYIWDIVQGVSLANFLNHIEGQGDGGIFDAKWSPDGTMIAATDSHGHILMFGYGSGHERLKQMPKELFFHTDYRPLIRDVSHHVMDEQTQTMPHLMPPPFLVDIDGNPYPPSMQRLVPGRENCPSDQLVPNIGIGNEGEPAQEGAYSNIDRMIEALANRQVGPDGGDPAPDSNNERENRNGMLDDQQNDPNRVNGRLPQGVQRYSAGNWHRDGSYKFHRRQYVRPMRHSDLQYLKQRIYASGLQEHEQYRREMRRRPLMINTSNNSSSMGSQANRRSGGRNGSNARPVRRSQANGDANGRQPAYRTRAVRDNEPAADEPPEQPETSTSETSNSDDSTAIEEELDLSGSSSTDSDSSDYSDWVSHEPGRNLEPPKRSKRKHVQRRTYSPPEIEQPGPSTGRRQKVRKIPITRDGEIPEPYRPPEWLSEVIPRKAPYYPQMGDEVVYFRQGHARYLEAVRTKNVYSLSNKCEPWSSMDLRDHEICKVIGIKYEIRPPRLCCLKLGIMSSEGTQTGRSFVIKYHDMPDVLDFLVLKQTFDTSVSRNWGPGDRFRCMIEDVWWLGQIESHNQLSPDFPDSLFMCFRVRWDNGEYELMSPWDLEPVDENRLPAEVGGAIPVLPEELRAMLYQPKAEEWPRGDRDASCRRIIAGLEQVMGLAIADLFLAPVDLNIYPEYAFVVEYPIDLNTIKARFENHFYRRITSAQFDVRYLATNAEKFNESHSNIVKHARIITDLCLRILGERNEVDVPAVYHQLVDTYISSDSDSESPRPGPSTSNNNRRRPAGSRRSRRLVPEGDWRVDCRELLEMIWQGDDSEPFREPVDTIQHPDYLQIVDTPMDLRTIKEDLLGGNYESPLDFAKDMKLIFQNSRNYNTNKRSRIYSMTLRLSTLFEAHIKAIIYNWKSARRRASKANAAKKASGGQGPSGSGTGGAGGSGSAPKSRRDDRSRGAGSSGAGPSSSRRPPPSLNSSGSSSRTPHSDYDDDDDDDDDESPPKRPTRNGTTMSSRRVQQQQPGGSSNGVTSSSNTVAHDAQPGPSRSRVIPSSSMGGPSSSGRVTRRSQDDEATVSSAETDTSSDSSDSSDDSRGVPVSYLRNYDSGDIYDPYKKNKRRKKTKSKKSDKQSSSKKGVVSSSTTKNKPPSGGSSSTPHVTRNERGQYTRLPHQQVQNQRNGNVAAGLAEPGPSRMVNRINQGSNSRTTNENNRDHDKPKIATGGTGGRTLRSTRSTTTGTDSDAEDAGEGSSTGRRPPKRQHRIESDHSYHMARPKTSRIISDTDNDDRSPRSTRGNARRAQAEWGRSDDSLLTPDDDERPSNSQTSSRRMRPRNRISDPEQSPEETSNISKRGSTQRAAAARARNWQVSESDNDPNGLAQSPEVPSTSSSPPSRTRVVRTNGSSAPAVPKSPSKPENRSTSRRLRNLSNSDTSATPPPHTVDHNYGEPSSRRTRLQPSRRQRPAAESADHTTPSEHTEEASDDDDAPLRPRTTTTQISSRLRSKKTPSPTKRKKPSTTSDDEVQDDSDEEFIGDAEEADSDEEATVESTDDDDSDDDNTPLRMMSSSSTAAAKSRRNRSQQQQAATAISRRRPPVPAVSTVASSSRPANISSRLRQRDRVSSEEEFGSPGPSTMRNSRNLKRPHYNEDSDEDDHNHGGSTRSRPKRPAIDRSQPSTTHHQAAVHHPSSPTTRSRSDALMSNGEDESGSTENSTEDNEALTSVSSRGRVRRINPKARKIFRD